MHALGGIAVAATLQPRRDMYTASILADDLASREALNAEAFEKLARQAMTDALFTARCVDILVGTVLMNVLGLSSEVLVESNMGLSLRWDDVAVCSGSKRDLLPPARRSSLSLPLPRRRAKAYFRWMLWQERCHSSHR